ncbi:MAG: GNAT family N-acetyltransferase, partial [Anaerolineae bacterium]|nr:GNAT family N-acetyltransferase [Anaerolineae bacterium]
TTLDAASESLLQAAFGMTAAEAEPYIERIRLSLQSGQAYAIGVFDSQNTPCGLAYWRWVNTAQTFARVSTIYTEPNVHPDLGAMLVTDLLRTLQGFPGIKAIEIQVRGDSPGVHDALIDHDLVFFERCQMMLPLTQMPLSDIVLPEGYSATLWTDDQQEEVEQVALFAQQDDIDSAAVPDAVGDELVETLRKLRSNEFPGMDHWLANASFVVRERRKGIIGYIATIQVQNICFVADMVVHPEHRRRGLARSLMQRSMTACLEDGFETAMLAVTTRNPARHLYENLGFRPTDCSESAIWWYDERQMAWRQ